MNSYPHMCRDGHVEIGHSDSESEMCPVCTLLSVLSDLSQTALWAAEWMQEHGHRNGARYLRECVQTARSHASDVQR